MKETLLHYVWQYRHYVISDANLLLIANVLSLWISMQRKKSFRKKLIHNIVINTVAIF